MSRDSGISQERKPKAQLQPSVVKFEGNGQGMGACQERKGFVSTALRWYLSGDD